jgi:hypothetical protein
MTTTTQQPQDFGRTIKAAVEEMVEEIDFIRACMQAGGDHEHAFWLMADSVDLPAAAALLRGQAEDIRRELERPGGG